MQALRHEVAKLGQENGACKVLLRIYRITGEYAMQKDAISVLNSITTDASLAALGNLRGHIKSWNFEIVNNM